MKKIEFMIRLAWLPAAALLLAFTGYWIFAGHYESVHRQLESERTRADRIQVDLKNSQETVDELAAAKESISEYLSDIFRIDETQKLIDRIGDKAVQHGATMADIQIDVPKFVEIRKEDRPEFPIPFQASFVGDFYSLGSLLSALEGAPFVYELTYMSLVPSGNAAEGLMMTVKGTVRFFRGDLANRYLRDGA